MKHAKKMMLVEAPAETDINKPTNTIVLQNNDPESYLRPNTIPNLDNELKKILHRTDIPDREKWTHFNQILRRYLFFLNEEKSKGSFGSSLHKFSPFNKAPVIDSKPQFRNIYDPSIPKQRHQNVHAFNFTNEHSEPSGSRLNNPSNDEPDYQQNDSFDQSDIPLLADHDSDLDEDLPNDDIDMTEIYSNRGKKRNSSVYTIFERKKVRRAKNEKPIYVWMPRPALNRWEIEQNRKAKTAKQKRLTEGYLKQNTLPERMEIEKHSNKRQHSDDFYDFDRSAYEYELTKKKPKVVLRRSEVDNILKLYKKAGSKIHDKTVEEQGGGSINSFETIIKWDKI